MRAFLLCATLLVAAPAATAQNLVVNGDFDSDLSGWLIDPAATPAPIWEDVDIDDPAGSGAVRVSNTSSEAMNRIYPLEQCIRLTEPGQYRILVHGYIPPGQGGGKLVASYWLSLDNPDCPQWQGSQEGGGNFIATVGGWGQYERVTGIVLPSPVPPNAMIKISLGIEKEAAGGSFYGFFDAVSVSALGDSIFEDGFD